MPDPADQVEWLTYSEMSERLGITVGSARTLAKRHRWARRTGNDTLARVAVPVARLNAADDPPNRGNTVPPNELGNDPRNEGGNEPPLAVAVQLARVEAEVSGLRDALARAEATAAVYRADYEAERARADGLVGDLLRIAERMAEAEAARAARPWWRRIAA